KVRRPLAAYAKPGTQPSKLINGRAHRLKAYVIEALRNIRKNGLSAAGIFAESGIRPAIDLRHFRIVLAGARCNRAYRTEIGNGTENRDEYCHLAGPVP